MRAGDAIATLDGKFVLIERQKVPFGLALPGGHIDPGETPKQTAVREFAEETGLVLHDAKFVTRRRGKKRDPRYDWSERTACSGTASGKSKSEAGFTEVVLLTKAEILKLPPDRFASDHHKILMFYFAK